MPEPRRIPKTGDDVIYVSGTGERKTALITHVYSDGNPESPVDLLVSGVEKRIGICYGTEGNIIWQWGIVTTPAPLKPPPNYEFDLEWLFAYHPPTPGNVKQHEAIKAGARAFVEVIIANAPSSVDRTKAIHQVRDAMYWAAAAVALDGRIYKQ